MGSDAPLIDRDHAELDSNSPHTVRGTLGRAHAPARLPFRAVSSPGATELLIVLVIVLLILGPKRLPSLGRQLGGGIREFRKSIGGNEDAQGSRDGVAHRDPVSERGGSRADGVDSERRAD